MLYVDKTAYKNTILQSYNLHSLLPGLIIVDTSNVNN